MLITTTDEIPDRMVQQATALGANTVITMRYMTSQTMRGAAEIVAFGTAVIAE